MVFKDNHRPIIAHIGYPIHLTAPSAKTCPLIFPSFCQWQLVQSDISGFGVHENGSTMHVTPDNAYSPHRGDWISNPHEKYG